MYQEVTIELRDKSFVKPVCAISLTASHTKYERVSAISHPFSGFKI